MITQHIKQVDKYSLELFLDSNRYIAITRLNNRKQFHIMFVNRLDAHKNMHRDEDYEKYADLYRALCFKVQQNKVVLSEQERLQLHKFLSMHRIANYYTFNANV